MKRQCRYEPLENQPLVLAICQVGFSPIRQMDRYMPAIQDTFRRNGFPIELAGRVSEVKFVPRGSPQVQMVEQQRWEFRTRNEDWSIRITAGELVMQTTAYTKFEDFSDCLRLSLNTVLGQSEHDKFGVIHRVGRRYVDWVNPSAGKDFRYYLRPGLHGVSDSAFLQGQYLMHFETQGRISVGGPTGSFVVRISQNLDGHVLPPDLLAAAPRYSTHALPGDLVKLIDMDHFVEGTFDPCAEWVLDRTFDLHDQIIETLHEQLVTTQAIEEWQ